MKKEYRVVLSWLFQAAIDIAQMFLFLVIMFILASAADYVVRNTTGARLLSQPLFSSLHTLQ